ncbi:MAG: sigma-70 family RNA polymerase sigma factor [Chloroflexota bacterium]|nr:sigma-70 family RNA polymerase sigma factor [Chloroflexota bacterium]
MSQEKKLLTRAKAWDQGALEKIYDRYNAELYAYAMQWIGNPGLAEECVAETFHRFLDVLRRGKGPDCHLRAYLYRTAHNWLMDQHRQQPTATLEYAIENPNATVESDEPNPLDTTLHNSRVAQTKAALSQITPDQRQALILRFIEDLSLKEVATAMERSVGAVKALQYRGLAAMRRVLEQGVDDERD